MKNIGNINNKNIGALLNSSNIYYEGGGKTLNKIIYPVGAVIIRVDSVNPSTWYGGTWELLCPGKTIICIDESDDAIKMPKQIGGSVNPLTKHTHGIRSVYSENGNVGVAYGAGGFWAVDKGSTTYSAGNNTNHNNWQPYMAVYIWVRTA